MVKISSWAAALLAYAVIPVHCAAVTVPKDNLALDANNEIKLFRFDIPDGDLSEFRDYISLGKRQVALPTILYRGSTISPEALMAAGGFLPRQSGGPLINSTYSLQSHHLGFRRTAYTSTSRSFGVGLGYSLKGKGKGWVYKVHPSPNMIDLNDSGFRLTFGAEEEFSALGGIPYDQIEAWIPMANADLKTKMTKADGLKFHDFETFSAEYPAKKWTVNPDYNHQKYDLLAASPGQPQLAGDDKNLAKYSDKTLEKYAIEFMEKNGAAVGWAGKFPLSFLNTPASSSEPAASAPAQTPSTQAPSTQNPSTQTPSTAKPNFWELEAKLCATGPDGKGKHGLDKNQCHREVSQCAFEAHKSPDSNWDTVIKCMDTKFLPAAH